MLLACLLCSKSDYDICPKRVKTYGVPQFSGRGKFETEYMNTLIYILVCSCAYTCTGYSGSDDNAAQEAEGP